MGVLIKLLLIAFLFIGSIWGLKSEIKIIGYISLFLSLYVLNEGFGFHLFTKITLAF
jgi:hypothetical protein